MGTAGGTGGMKPSGTAGGAEDMGAWAGNSWEGGVAPARTGLGWGARTDLVTSSNQRSASDDERLWEVTGGEEVGGATMPAGDDQSLPAGRRFVYFIRQTRRLVREHPLPGCTEGGGWTGAPAGFLAQGLVSRTGRAGGRAGGLAAAAAGTGNTGVEPFTVRNSSACTKRRERRQTCTQSPPPPSRRLVRTAFSVRL